MTAEEWGAAFPNPSSSCFCLCASQLQCIYTALCSSSYWWTKTEHLSTPFPLQVDRFTPYCALVCVCVCVSMCFSLQLYKQLHISPIWGNCYMCMSEFMRSWVGKALIFVRRKYLWEISAGARPLVNSEDLPCKKKKKGYARRKSRMTAMFREARYLLLLKSSHPCNYHNRSGERERERVMKDRRNDRKRQGGEGGGVKEWEKGIICYLLVQI